MKRFALYLAGPLVMWLLLPLASGPVGLELYLDFLGGAAPVALMFSLLVAVPLFMIATRKLRTRAPVLLGLAFVAGFISFLVFTYSTTPPHANAVIGGVVYLRDGSFTIAGWKAALAQSAQIGLASIPGGIPWWFAARTPSDRDRQPFMKGLA